MKWSESHSVVSNSLQLHGLYSPWNSPGQNTRVGSLSLLLGIFPTQGLNPGLPHCRQILYQLSHKGSPRILEWVACPFSSGSSYPRDQTRVSCIAGGFFAKWAIREALKSLLNLLKYCFCFMFCFAFLGGGVFVLAMMHVGTELPDQGLIPYPSTRQRRLEHWTAWGVPTQWILSSLSPLAWIADTMVLIPNSGYHDCRADTVEITWSPLVAWLVSTVLREGGGSRERGGMGKTGGACQDLRSPKSWQGKQSKITAAQSSWPWDRPIFTYYLWLEIASGSLNLFHTIL